MIKTLYNIGRLIESDYPEYFRPWQNPFPKGEALVIAFHIEKGILTGKYDIEPFSSQKVDYYLFREAKARATNLVPTFYLQTFPETGKQENEYSKKMEKIEASLKNYYHTFTTIGHIKEELPSLLSNLELDSKKSYLLTFKIDGLYFGEFEAYKNLFYEEAYKAYAKSASEKKVCAVTYKESEQVWGRVNTLGFTVDDLTFSRNGFDQGESYKMFPVSPDAVKILEGTNRFVEDKMSYNFYGLKYYLLPHMVAMSEDLAKEITDLFIAKRLADTLQNIGNALIGNEQIITDIITEESGREMLSRHNVYYDIFFYQRNNSQFLIKLHLSDVLPSRFKRIFDVKKAIEKIYQPITKREIQKKGQTDKETIPFWLNFGLIKDFFSKKAKTETIYHPYFFKILEAVFYGTSLNEQTILQEFMNKIRISFKNQHENAWEYPQDVKYSFAVHQFFSTLNLFKMNNMEQQANEKSILNLDGFIEQHPYFFNSEYKKGVFMAGCLTEVLLAKQRSKLKSEPFSKHLNGLSIDEKTLQSMLPKLIQKLREYEVTMPELEGRIAQALVTENALSKVETSYAFTLGMIMQREFTRVYFQNKRDSEANNDNNTEQQ